MLPTLGRHSRAKPMAAPQFRNNDKEIKEKAEFPGGEEALTTYLLQKVNESPVIRNCKLKGNADIFFYIDETGKVIGSRIKTADGW
jgi:hypothetical protein